LFFVGKVRRGSGKFGLPVQGRTLAWLARMH